MNNLKKVGIISFLIFIVCCGIQASLTRFNPDLNDCGASLGCFRYPPQCDSFKDCDNFLVWNDTGSNSVQFLVSAKINSQNTNTKKDFWTAVSFNSDTKMTGGKVVDCIYMSSSANFTIQSSYNPGTYNTILSDPMLGLVPDSLEGSYEDNILQCSFIHYKEINSSNPEYDKVPNLNPEQSYFISLGIGPASSSGVKQIHIINPVVSDGNISMETYVDMGGNLESELLYKIHGILMVLAWILFSTIGELVARYYKPMLYSSKILGAAVWFRIHQLCMGLTTVLTAAGFVVVFVEMKTYFPVSTVHPILGIIVMALVLANPIMALFRPPAGHKYRPLFYYAHTTVAFLAQSTAGAAMVLGVRFDEVDQPGWVFWVVLGWVIARLLVDVLLSLHRYLSKKYSSVPYKNVNEPPGEDDSILNFNKQKQTTDQPKVPTTVHIVGGIFILLSVGVTTVTVVELVIALTQEEEYN